MGHKSFKLEYNLKYHYDIDKIPWVKIDSSFLQFSLPTSAQRYLKHFQSSNILALLEKSTIL